MKAVIITIGDELLIGQTIDSNSSWIGSEMNKIGFEIKRIISVGDNKKEILSVLGDNNGKVDVVLITGGLGPTRDDITKNALCEFFGTKLTMNKVALKMIENMMEKRGYPMNELNRRQAEVPETCKVLNNCVGTAPGIMLENKKTLFISLPGVPFEMKHIMEESVLPMLKKRFNSQIIIHKNIMTYGISESSMAELLTEYELSMPSNMKLGFLPSAGIVKLRLTCTGTTREHIEMLIEKKVQELYGLIPEYIYSDLEESMEMTIGKILLSNNNTLSLAESCTGGNIARLITSVPGSSGYFKGSVVSYDNSVKKDVLGVREEIINEFGAVSRQVVESMAIGGKKLFKTDYCIATSGIAGPSGGTIEKPVGTLWIAVTSDKGTNSQHFNYGTDRTNNINRFSIAALDLLLKHLKI